MPTPVTAPKLVIPSPAGEPYWWDDPTQAALVEHYISARRALGDRFHGALLVTGPAGSGKTEGVLRAARQYAERHQVEMPVLKMDCATITDPQKWFGRREVDRDGTRFVRSDFVTAVEEGGAIVLDDVSRLHATLHNPIMALLDGSNAVKISDLNLTVRRHRETVFLGTANPAGPGVHRMDPAMRERFPYGFERPWPPRADEIKILTTRTGCDADGAARLVEIAAKTRGLAERRELSMPISTRTLVAAAWLVASGMTETQALEVTAVQLFDPESTGYAGATSERTTVRQIISGKMS